MYYDLIVNLYHEYKINVELKTDKVSIKRLLSPNSDRLVEFVEKNFTKGWASEIKAAIYKNNPTCFIAVSDNEIVGFACYDATAKGYFGPTGVNENFRGLNIGQVLLQKCLTAMKNDGYGYAIIGSVGEKVISFYSKYIELTPVSSSNSVYVRLINK